MDLQTMHIVTAIAALWWSQILFLGSVLILKIARALHVTSTPSYVPLIWRAHTLCTVAIGCNVWLEVEAQSFRSLSQLPCPSFYNTSTLTLQLPFRNVPGVILQGTQAEGPWELAPRYFRKKSLVWLRATLDRPHRPLNTGVSNPGPGPCTGLRLVWNRAAQAAGEYACTAPFAWMVGTLSWADSSITERWF